MDNSLFGSVFLMHRVELKDNFNATKLILYSLVPNAPCGVESNASVSSILLKITVPNAPCGVESDQLYKVLLHLFWLVPNAPCGVESL